MNWLLRWAGPRLAIAGNRVCLDRRRLFILPSGAGLAYAALLVVLLLFAMNYNNNMMFAFTFLLGGIGANAMWQTHRNLLGLCVSLLPPAELFADHPASLQVLINTDGRPRRALEFVWDLPRAAPDSVLASAIEDAPADLPLPRMRRGLQALPPLRITTRYPLGLFRAWSLLPYTTRLLVYPKPAAQTPPMPTAPTGSGEHRGHSEQEDDFDGLRPYRSSDPPRRIAWRASARSDELLSKSLHGRAAEHIWLDWQALAGHDSETRLSILCRWVLDADRHGLRYGLRLPQRSVEPAQGLAHRHACLRLLALHGGIE
ncbi:DUF58 domain-containing protein [Acidihalobacter ferrooxydans]|uniref:Uncharacterized protein n=1 Tax=Acidihalobacter ferrooxydans TaxID=1765967 RepID=A0A1P8UFS1_9GAMM|nr:DUF58 domain-containing protein [Acidihalobacter ferrooxydans]APZ42685.1 hypothetical protein BW247_05880 [Acidihalobacter ferrooxydans]